MPRHGDGTRMSRSVYRYLSYAVDVYIRISVLQKWETPRALLNLEAPDKRNEINATKNQHCVRLV